jgi:hypothetical protein
VEAFNALPDVIRHLGLWTGGAEDDVNRLRLPYRSILAEQGFVVIYEHASKLQLETVAGVHARCPQCKGSGRVPMHHVLRDKACPRCSGRGWIN